MDIKELRQTADNLFGKRLQYMVLLQEIAENFYPERADFTITRVIGQEFAPNIMISYPLLCRRDLSDQFSTMLRPTAKNWFKMGCADERREDNDSKRWLEWAAGTMRRAMYDRATQFTRATKEGDNDFAAFGGAVLSARLNRNLDALLYRCWHLRDVAWTENEEGQINFIARKWKPYARDLVRLFPKTDIPALTKVAAKTPFTEIECYHIVCEADMYDGDARRKPYWSIYFDITHNAILEAMPTINKEYFIPRWQTVSGSQYPYSPATVASLGDARLIQAMTYTLLEAGEKAVNPPMVATEDAVRSDIAVYAGGITWVDMEYDEKLGEALRPLTQDTRNLPFGVDMQRDLRAMINQAFYLNKLTLPQRTPEMTAYEVGQRIQEYIRGALPLFEPMENEYNGALCEITFDIMLRAGAFGSPHDMPKRLRGAEIQFKFESPLHDAIEQQKGQKWIETKQILADAAAIYPPAVAMIDAPTALRDVLNGIQTPAKWVKSEAQVKEAEDQMQAQQNAQALLDKLQQGSEIAKNVGGAQPAAGASAVPAAAVA